ncbi:hypothetical protein DFJ73DRAFT_967741 [Zopfochytrium polystomum]|nr:hypothetical protein DFJ73DRAFT_967741 [Zopfochytrium polystomum]
MLDLVFASLLHATSLSIKRHFIPSGSPPSPAASRMFSQRAKERSRGGRNNYESYNFPDRPQFIAVTQEPANRLSDRELIHLCTKVYLYEPPLGKEAGEYGGGGGGVDEGKESWCGIGAGGKRKGGVKEAATDVVEVTVVEKEERKFRRRKVQDGRGVGEVEETAPSENVECRCSDHGGAPPRGGEEGAAEDADNVVSNPTILEQPANAAYSAAL